MIRQASTPQLSEDPKVINRLQDSVDVLFDHLAKGWYVYGMPQCIRVSISTFGN
jgi:hypothetical protein